MNYIIYLFFAMTFFRVSWPMEDNLHKTEETIEIASLSNPTRTKIFEIFQLYKSVIEEKQKIKCAIGLLQGFSSETRLSIIEDLSIAIDTPIECIDREEFTTFIIEFIKLAPLSWIVKFYKLLRSRQTRLYGQLGLSDNANELVDHILKRLQSAASDNFNNEQVNTRLLIITKNNYEYAEKFLNLAWSKNSDLLYSDSKINPEKLNDENKDQIISCVWINHINNNKREYRPRAVSRFFEMFYPNKEEQKKALVRIYSNLIQYFPRTIEILHINPYISLKARFVEYMEKQAISHIKFKLWNELYKNDDASLDVLLNALKKSYERFGLGFTVNLCKILINKLGNFAFTCRLDLDKKSKIIAAFKNVGKNFLSLDEIYQKFGQSILNVMNIVERASSENWHIIKHEIDKEFDLILL